MSIETLTNNKAVMFGLAVLAFLVAAVLVIMIFRMLFGGRLRMPGGRSRQARLGIVDAFDLDRQRQLIIVRRDNVEHLIMIGGPNDLVVESEIVRAEARDLRREPGFGDGRIPAPPPATIPEPAQLPPRGLDDAMVPLAPPVAAEVEGGPIPAAPPPRGPTFPLPPRRPAPPPAVAPERRPAAPPKLPETVSRGDDVPALSGQPPAPAPAPPQPVPPPVARPAASPQPAPQAPTPPVAPAAPVAPPPAGPSAAPPPARPPFLKPLPPRPPVRPLQRTTPQPPGPPAPNAAPGVTAGAPAGPAAPNAAPPPAGPSAAGPQPPRPAQRPLPPKPSVPLPPRPPAPVAPPKPAAAAPTPTNPPAPQEADALESLEEEMAKLLGRGS